MPGSRRQASTAAALLLLAITAASIQADVTSSVIVGALSKSSTGPSTCPSRSINYITQSLPQQCLTTSWASKRTSLGSNTNESSSFQDKLISSSLSTGNAAEAAPALQSSSSSTSSSSGNTSGTSTRSEEAISSSHTTAAVSSLESTYDVDPEAETDSPLDNANFLSFEEWKRQNLAKAGQSAENLGTRVGSVTEQRRRPGGINNALDTLGEDTEIEIDFGGFVNPGASAHTKLSQKPYHANGNVVAKDDAGEGKPLEDLSGTRRRGKDAGKTCKERSNYASFDCAATVLKTNTESKGSTAVLVENKDSYLLNICSANNKFLIVELCDDILIDTVVLANFEFFSSMFRTFRVSVSDSYPVKLDKWRELGTFEARNSREVQAFLVENPLIWARYLRVEFLTHFGNEYYCPVSLLRVHGTTMMEEFNHELKRSDTESDASDADEEDGIDFGAGIVSAEALKEQVQKTSKMAEESPTPSPSTKTAMLVETSKDSPSTVDDAVSPESESSLAGFTPHDLSLSSKMKMLSSLDESNLVCTPEDRPANIAVPLLSVPSRSDQSVTTSQVYTLSPNAVPLETSSQASEVKFENYTQPTKLVKSSETVFSAVSDHPASQNVSQSSKPSNQTSVSSAKVQASSTQPSNANPTTQESFFKSVHKRLQLLESNSTLSLQYIEEQSRILREAFSKVEKRQLAKTTTFLESLNTTVLTELREFRNQYDQIWQSTVLELSSQREQSQHEVFALSARLSLLADEIIFQKRMAIFQFILILLCLGLALFSRHGSTATYLEFPHLVQSAINKSSANLSRYTPRFETPPASPSSTRPSSRYGLFRGFSHCRSPSDESQLGVAVDGRKSASLEFSPPTSGSQSSPGDDHEAPAKDESEDYLSDGPQDADANTSRQMKCSPATASGKRNDQRDFAEEALLRRDGYEGTHLDQSLVKDAG
ncbi:hypothetical protein MMC28_007591 [Mycoblastus sanguinarius]|nr:hypothetical protein [Mycoblastus sanguinarius]